MARKYKRSIEQGARPTPGDWTEPRIYRTPEDRPSAVTVYGGQSPLRAVFTIRDPEPEDLANAQMLSRTEALRRAVEALVPLGDNGLIDELWSVCRRSGDHRLAEQVTETSNAIRAILAAMGAPVRG